MFKVLPVICYLINIISGGNTANNVSVKYIEIRHKIFQDWHSHDVADGEYPYVVSLALINQMVVTRHCTGSMIHKTWVLSSAHCFYDILDKQFYVWYGNYTVSPLISNMYSKVIKIFIHPSFHDTEFTKPGYFFGDNDISLLRVGKIAMSNYGRLSSIDHTKMYGLPVTYIGGAAKNKRWGDHHRPLQVAEGEVIKCGLALTMWSKYVLCVTPKCSDRLHQPVHGDFGGPYIFDGKIVGVMSLNFQIPKTYLSSNGLTPISPYKNWIKQYVRRSNNKV